MGKRPTVEVCIDSLESARIVSEVMQDDDDFRIELCSNLIVGGGLTPTMGLLKACKTVIDASRIMVMIRPRIGSFVYSHDEVQVMLYDISSYKAEGVRGFVFGCLTPAGDVDMDNMRLLVNAAAPYAVTFHRAFDVVGKWQKAHGDILSLDGVSRISSGQAHTALQGVNTLSDLLACSRRPGQARKLTIMVASGVNASTFTEIRAALGDIDEVHLTSSCVSHPNWMTGDEAAQVIDRGTGFGFGGGDEWKMDKAKLAEFLRVIRG